MKDHGTVKRYTLEEFNTNIINVGDELVTEDYDGKAIFQVAEIRKNYIYMIRKFLLEDDKPMRTETFDLMEWLNDKYLSTLPQELRDWIVSRKGNHIFLPKEVEVFGEPRWSSEDEKGKQWELFKKSKQRIRLRGGKEGNACFWWECSPCVSSSADFCGVNTSGDANLGNASAAFGVAPCFRIPR